MKISSVRIYRYDTPFPDPVTVKGYRLENREFILVRTEDEEGRCGWGEISPLPGLHKETLRTAQRQLEEKSAMLLSARIDDEALVEYGAPYCTAKTTAASVIFGLDTALLSLAARRSETSLSRLFSKTPERRININALLSSGPPDSLLAEAASRYDEGFRFFKVKVGWSSVEDDIERIQALQKQYQDRIKLILDGNRSWSLEEAVHFAIHIERRGLLYIEEPLIDPEQLPDFHRRTGKFYALDESISEKGVDCPMDGPGLRAVILKMNTLGFVCDTVDIIKKAREHNLIPVISSSFNSGLGISFMAQFAAAMCGEDSHAGLDTRRMLGDDILTVPLPVIKGTMDTQHAANSEISVNEKKLELISEYA